MQWRSSSSHGTWTTQQRFFFAVAVMLCLVALGICAVRLQASRETSGPGDGLRVLVTGPDAAGRR